MREPVDFEISHLSVVATHSAEIPAGPGYVMSHRFTAHAVLARPHLIVEMDVRVDGPGAAFIVGLKVTPGHDGAISPTSIRKLLVDRILREALGQAVKPVNEDGDAGVAGTPHLNTLTAPKSRADSMAARAAAIYLRAVGRGSHAPGCAVAAELGRSRIQAARYIRRARELGLLPPLEAPDASGGDQVVSDLRVSDAHAVPR